MYDYPPNFLNDLYLSGFKLLNLTTYNVEQVEVNESGILLVQHTDNIGDYTALNTTNISNYLPINIYLAKPEIKPLYMIMMGELQKIRDGLKNI
jgi:hypothetical protein